MLCIREIRKYKRLIPNSLYFVKPLSYIKEKIITITLYDFIRTVLDDIIRDTILLILRKLLKLKLENKKTFFQFKEKSAFFSYDSELLYSRWMRILFMNL